MQKHCWLLCRVIRGLILLWLLCYFSRFPRNYIASRCHWGKAAFLRLNCGTFSEFRMSRNHHIFIEAFRIARTKYIILCNITSSRIPSLCSSLHSLLLLQYKKIFFFYIYWYNCQFTSFIIIIILFQDSVCFIDFFMPLFFNLSHYFLSSNLILSHLGVWWCLMTKVSLWRTVSECSQF